MRFSKSLTRFSLIVLPAIVAVFANVGFHQKAFAQAQKKNEFALDIRTTDPLSPEDQQKTFKLLPGFKIQLVTAEPNTRKPMNMAFDVSGRLWFTESREYPIPVKGGGEGRDTVRIASDFDEKGRAKTVKVFADKLNIPIGIYPFRTADKPGAKPTWKCIVWSIPNIWLFTDTDGDDVADKREVLQAALGWERDTHGNLASFRRGLDGWLYGTHGYNNISEFRGKDGSSYKVQGGHIWRMNVDANHVEQFTYGQVNPFGLCFDPRENLFSADCHTLPIYQLLRGGWYPNFGAPDDGVGFSPTTFQHKPTSTAISGITYVSDPNWPTELQNDILVGDVMSSKIVRDHIQWFGSSSKGVEKEDFLRTTDPWFRPVDLQMGPDGALYIADFYNRIIGHYEVSLTHPARDRERGRIWRVVRVDEDGTEKAQSRALPADIAGLVKELGSANTTRRRLAINELCDVQGQTAVAELQKAAADVKQPIMASLAMQALERLGKLSDETLLTELRSDAKPTESDISPPVMALRIASERKTWSDKIRRAVTENLDRKDALRQRYAALGLGRHPQQNQVETLIRCVEDCPKRDDHLLHTIRMALRDQLNESSIISKIDWKKFNPGASSDLIVEMLGAVHKPESVAARLDYFAAQNISLKQYETNLPHMIKFAAESEIEKVVALARTASKEQEWELHEESKVITLILEAVAKRLKSTPDELKQWSSDIISRMFADPALKTADRILAMRLIRLSHANEHLQLCSDLSKDEKQPFDVRESAADAWLELDRPNALKQLLAIVGDKNVNPELRTKYGLILAAAKMPDALPVLMTTIKTLPTKSQQAWVDVLVHWHDAAKEVCKACDEGSISIFLLRNSDLQDRMKEFKDPALTELVTKISHAMPDRDREFMKLINARTAAVAKRKGNAENGQLVFTKNCAICHQIGGKGVVIGPQLDGIGGRGRDRLLEDVLDPNRNVDPAFRMIEVELKTGIPKKGLKRRITDTEIVIADQEGKESTIQKSDIEGEPTVLNTSLMPTVAQTMVPQELADLIAFLLEQRSK